MPVRISVRSRTEIVIDDRTTLLAAAQALAVAEHGPVPLDVPGAVRTLLTRLDVSEVLVRPEDYGLHLDGGVVVAAAEAPAPGWSRFPFPDVDPDTVLLHLETARHTPGALPPAGLPDTVIVDPELLMAAAEQVVLAAGQESPHDIGAAMRLLADQLGAARRRRRPERFGLRAPAAAPGVPRQRTEDAAPAAPVAESEQDDDGLP